MTPPIPLSARRVCTPRLCCGGKTDSPGGEGDGGSKFWKTREIGLPSYSKICIRWVRLRRQCEDTILAWALAFFVDGLGGGMVHTDKKKIKFSSYIRQFRRDRLQSHIWLNASSYMVEFWRNSSYFRKPLLKYDFAPDPISEFRFLFYQCSLEKFFLKKIHGLRSKDGHDFFCPCCSLHPSPPPPLTKNTTIMATSLSLF